MCKLVYLKITRSILTKISKIVLRDIKKIKRVVSIILKKLLSGIFNQSQTDCLSRSNNTKQDTPLLIYACGLRYSGRYTKTKL
jgi:hypothetical protein